MFKRRKPDRESDDDNPLASRLRGGDDRPTQPLGEAPEATRPMGVDPDAPTRIMVSMDAAATKGTDDPPVGLLVIIEGPGRGTLHAIGYGMNTVGRGRDARLRLDHGDERISRSEHARVVFDPDSRRFYLQHGAAANLTYHNDAPVLEPVRLEDGDRIRFGATTLLFRPLVSDDFDWRSDPAAIDKA